MPVNTQITLRRMAVADLKPAPYNPRREIKTSNRAYMKLRRSLERFGLVDPLIWNERSGHVVGGHLRLRVLRDLEICHIDVSVVQLTHAEEKALNVVLNNQDAQGRYDRAKLHAVLLELRDLPEFEGTGFDDGVFRLLEFAPLAEFPEAPLADTVTITLQCPLDEYPHLQPTLDELIWKHTLGVHVQRGVREE